MTNNLKAERTLTAEELQAIVDDANGEYITRSGIIFTVRQAKSPDPATVIDMALELQHLRSQSLSTQQPMGEVRVWMVTEILPSGVKRWQCVEHEFDAHQRALQSPFPTEVAPLYALHPNQESGE